MTSSCAERQRARQHQTTGGGGLILLLVVTFAAFVNYAALLSVAPMWVSSGGAASLAVGNTTGVMMGATVTTQLAAGPLFKLFGLRHMMVVGAVLLGAPTPLYVLSTDVGWVMAITAVRGIGFAMVVMSGATLVADLAKEGRLASSASLYGAAAALPNLGALAGGVWAAETWGFVFVFWGGGIASVVGAVLAIGLPADARGQFALATVADARRLVGPVGLFLLTAASFGAVTTFVPVAGPGAGQASLALLVASAALVIGRLSAGALGDRTSPGRLLPLTVLMVAGGLALVAEALRATPSLLVVGAMLLGAGFGAAQNDSFVATVQRLGPARTGTASTIWNIAYDGGLGVGAAALGWAIGTAGYATAFLCMAAGVAIATVTAQVIPTSARQTLRH